MLDSGLQWSIDWHQNGLNSSVGPEGGDLQAQLESLQLSTVLAQGIQEEEQVGIPLHCIVFLGSLPPCNTGKSYLQQV